MRGSWRSSMRSTLQSTTAFCPAFAHCSASVTVNDIAILPGCSCVDFRCRVAQVPCSRFTTPVIHESVLTNQWRVTQLDEGRCDRQWCK
eukprot:15451820-Alexandrium_andersonii.AAC.1